MSISLVEKRNAETGHDVLSSGAVICHIKNRRFGRTVSAQNKHFCPHCSNQVYAVA